MSITYNYRNSIGRDITVEQAQQINAYSKANFKNGEIQKVEGWASGNLKVVDWYLQDGQSHQEAKTELLNLYPNLGSFTTRERKMVGEYKKEIVVDYIKHVFFSKLLKVYNANDYLFAVKGYHSETSNQLGMGASKFLYGESLYMKICAGYEPDHAYDDEFMVFSTLHDEDGLLEEIRIYVNSPYDKMRGYKRDWYDSQEAYEAEMRLRLQRGGLSPELVDYYMSPDIFPIPEIPQ